MTSEGKFHFLYRFARRKTSRARWSLSGERSNHRQLGTCIEAPKQLRLLPREMKRTAVISTATDGSLELRGMISLHVVVSVNPTDQHNWLPFEKS